MTCSDVIIRTALYSDLEGVFRIELESFRIPYPKQYLAALLALAGDLFLVAETREGIVGYAVGVLRVNNMGHIVSIAVAKRWRRKGIGTKLIRELERRFREKKMKVSRLEVRVSNEPAIRLYERLGYKIIHRVKNYYPDGEDAYLMIKEL